MVSCSFYPCRVYRKFRIATSLGHYIDIQNGEANALVEAACDTFNFMEVEQFPSISELLLKFEVQLNILVLH